MNQDKTDTEIFVYMGLMLLALVAVPVLLVRSWHRVADWLLTHHALVPANDALVTLPGTQAGLDLRRLLIAITVLVILAVGARALGKPLRALTAAMTKEQW